MSTLLEQLSSAVLGRSPLIYLYSPEEERVLRGLRSTAAGIGDGLPVHVWSCVEGLEGVGDSSATCDPVVALQSVLREGGAGFYVFRDLAAFMERPEVIRALRDVYYTGRSLPDRYVFILDAELVMPESLKKEVHFLEISPPDEGEISSQIGEVVSSHPEYSIPEDAVQEVTLALKGLTESEIRHVLHRVCQLESADKDALLDEIFAEKRNIVKKSGYLEFSPPRWTIGDIGGLDNLKAWLTKREGVFSREAVEAGIPIPKGLLMMGVSGCGKSLAVKVISSLWGVPMFRLDMNLVFSGMYGSPEEAFHRALRTIESVAPAGLWIAEIENALGIEEEGVKIEAHIFSTFLTWMQEKPPMIFIAATANRIQALPAEIIRKGRFDEVFFCDLPASEERQEIFRIHLERQGANCEDFDFKMLAIMSDGWNGAEIEQAVISARTDAYYEGRQFGQRDLTTTMGKIVPLSDTMEQQIKGIRSWAFSRATPAPKFGKSRRR